MMTCRNQDTPRIICNFAAIQKIQSRFIDICRLQIKAMTFQR